MSALSSHLPRTRHRQSGFSLVELLVVMLIISLTFGCFLAFMGNSMGFTTGTYTIQGIFEQAQSVAVTRSTYVWVGIFEEDPATPGVPGVGQLAISAVASVNGTNLLSQVSAGSLPTGSLTQLMPLVKIPNLHVQTTLNPSNITALPTASYQIDPTVNNGVANFVYPLQGSPVYTFTQIIQFDPQGDASVIYGSPVQVLQLGLIPAAGNTALTNSKNVSAIQICGIGGKATVYRPQ